VKLGIVVVYMVQERDEKLLDLHLHQLERHTTVPYAIYGSTIRLLPRFRSKLERHPAIRLSDPPAAGQRGAAEHASHLDHQIERALADGATHVAVLHVDSFPVRAGWAEELTGRLSPSCVLTAVMRHRAFDQKPSTICLSFAREFHLRYRPRLLVAAEERRLPGYREYRRAFELIEDSGSGYGFELFRRGLSWHPMTDTSNGESRNCIGAVYDDLVFHLGGAVRHGLRAAGSRRRRAALAPLQSLKQRLRPAVPRPIRQFLARHPDALPVLDSINRGTFEEMRERLLADPEGLFAELRAERRP
jgi:hypothetical protein